MKKFSKVLCLVLVLAMMAGLCCFGTSAAFADADKITYKEAAGVMEATKIMVGDDNGFRPTDGLTRAEACVMIAKLCDAADIKGTCSFKDVKGHWAEQYVAYCAAEGYVSGYSKTAFGPDDALTGSAWALMLLRVLGYDPACEGIGGDTWEIGVAKLVKATDLAKGIEKFDGTKTITREQAAQLALNALQTTTVKYADKGTSIKINGAEITTGASKAEAVYSGSAYAQKIEDTVYLVDGNPVSNVQLGEDLFDGKLELEKGTSDALKHSAHKWTFKAKEVGTYADKPEYTFVATKGYTIANATDLTDAINDQLKITKTADKLKFEDGDTMHTNGGNSAWTNIALGSVVEVYVSAANKKDITSVVVTAYSIGQISKIDTKLTKAQTEDGVTCKVSIKGGNTYLDTKIAGFDADTFVKDAYILYVDKGGNELIATAFPTEVTGEVTAIKGSKAAIDGTYYENALGVSNGDKGTFYLGMADEIIFADATASKSTDYAYIYNVTRTNKANADGVEKDTITVYYVTVDGAKASAVAKVKTSVAGTVTTYYLDKNGANGTVLGTYDTTGTVWTPATSVVAFSTDADGKFVEKTAKDGIATAQNNIGIGKTDPVVDNTKVATGDTTFVFVYVNSKGAYEAKLATGYKNVAVTADAGTYVTSVYNTTKDEALYTFVASATNANEFKSDTKLAVVLDKTPVVTTAAGDTFKTYTVAINGEETALTFKAPADLTSPYAGMVFEYKMNGDNAEVDSYIAEDAVASKGADYFVNNSAAAYQSTADATIYTITLEFANAADKASYEANHATFAGKVTATVGEGATFDAGDPVYYTLKAGSATNVDVVFVVEYVF